MPDVEVPITFIQLSDFAGGRIRMQKEGKATNLFYCVK